MIAGTGVRGSASDRLNGPRNIFVDTNLDLYVADQDNNRIQLFQSDQRNGIIAVGQGSLPPTIELSMPAGVVLDGDRYIFIVDKNNDRIIGSDRNGFHCIVGCSGRGTTIHQLNWPVSMSFDSNGNIYVDDANNNRIQKFVKITCSTEVIITPDDEKRKQCFSPIIKLIPEINSPTTPYQYRRSQDFYILSTIGVNCNNSFSTIKKWSIKNYNSIIDTNNSELYIPSNTLSYGIHRLELTVTMTDYPNLTNSVSIYVQISRTGIIANLVPLGTSVVTHDHQQNLILNPGNYSIDPDDYEFNASDWSYKYFCRIYESTELFLSLEECLSNRSNIFEYNDVKSSLIIFANVLQLNLKYQFLVQMVSRRNRSLQATGYAIVQITDSTQSMIAIGCVIQSLCAFNRQFQKINPTTQVALFSYCVHECSNVKNIIWNIYHGRDRISTNENRWFFGQNTTKLTATKDLFLRFPNETYWKFEVIYSFGTSNSTSALHFEINQPPSDGSCDINPKIGTISTLFIVTCFDWQIEENIKDYSLYTTFQQIIAFSSVSSFEVRLPIGNHVNLIVHIRDIMNGITKYNLSSVTVLSESINLTEQSFIELLSSGNQNTIGQIITLINNELNQILEKAIPNGLSLISMSISSLKSSRMINIPTSSSVNESARLTFNKEINHLANLREYFINFTSDLTIVSANSLKLQSLPLVQLTNGTNQLTRTILIVASKKCYQLTHQLYQWLNKLPYEDVQIIATQLLQCTSNILSAVNGPLQKRTAILEKDRRFYFQKKLLANELNNKINEINSLLTLALNLHLNLGQQYTIDTSEVFMSLETMSVQSFHNKMNVSSNLNPNQIISFRSTMEPVAIYGKSRITNLSRSISFSILNENGREIPFETSQSTPIEFLIPRDPNLEIPRMISTNQSFHSLNFTNDLPIAIHFEINANFSYLFLYKFDAFPIYTSSIRRVDGWTLVINHTNFTYMIDNQRTVGHRFLIFGLQEYNSQFSNYEYRIYASGCYYLNKDNEWTTNGLLVGPKTNLYQTHCYSMHLYSV